MTDSANTLDPQGFLSCGEVAAPRGWTAGEARRAMARAPVVGLTDLCGDGAVLIVAPHPDDESLGCGGLIALAADAGRSVVVAILTDGAASHPGSRRFPAERLAALREAEAREAVRRLAGGRAEVICLRLPDGRLQEHEHAARDGLQAAAAGRRFTGVAAPWEADPHPDHKAALRVAAALAREAGAGLLAYPVWGLTLPDPAPAGDAAPCVRLDVSSVLERKRSAVAAHRSQTTALIDDDPQGFRLTPADLARHADGWETYLRVGASRAR